MPSKSIALVTGGFDPIHSGHIALFKEAATMGDLFVGVNSDQWLKDKKGYCFMPLEERMEIISNLQMIDQRFNSRVFKFNDTNIDGDKPWTDGSAIDAIEKVLANNNQSKQVIFINGGDRTKENIPEASFYYDEGQVQFAFGVGGTDKINSSSTIGRVERSWGWYKVLYNAMTTKVKELCIEPGRSISLQRHFKRNEFWFVSEGECTASVAFVFEFLKERDKSVILTAHERFIVPVNTWHSLYNHTDKPCNIVEIQYGKECEELDIERKEND